MLLFVVFACFYGQHHAQNRTEQLESVQVDAKVFAQKKNVEGKIIQVMDSLALSVYQGQSLSNAINALPGVYIGGANSKAGSPKSIYIRGGGTKQVLILLDGIPMNDASSIDNSFDLNLIPLETIERIELMKGASSTLYGSGAAVAVINLISKKQKEEGLSVNFNSSFKTEQEVSDSPNFNRIDNSLILGSNFGDFHVQVQGVVTNSKGISEAYDPNGEFEKDSFDSQSIQVNMGQKLTNSFKMDLFYMYQNNDQDYDAGAFTDSELNNSKSELNRLVFQPEYRYAKGAVTWQNSYSNLRRTLQAENTWAGGIDDYKYLTESFKSDLFNQVQISDQLENISGMSFDYQNTANYGPYELVQGALYQFRSVDLYSSFSFRTSYGLGLDAGARYNYHNVYKSNLTYDANVFYQFNEQLRVNTSYSTAYIVPSLYQLFSQYGNTDLVPESSENFEIGLAYEQNERWSVGLTYFNRSDKDPIIFYTDPETFASYYVNDLNAIYKFSGIEFEFDIELVSNLDLNLSYTHTELDEEKSNYTPKDLARAQVSYDFKIHNFMLNYQYNGDRFVEDFRAWPAEILTLEAYSLLDFNYRIRPTDFMSINVAANNILNAEFTERLGYSTLGRNYMLGLNFNF